MAKRKLTEEQKKSLIKLSACGVTNYSLAKKFGISLTTVKYHIDNNYKIKCQNNYKRKYKEDPEFRKRILSSILKYQRTNPNYKKYLENTKEKRREYQRNYRLRQKLQKS